VVTVSVDNTAPTGGLIAPVMNGAVGGSTVSVSSNSADAGAGLNLVQFQVRASGTTAWTNLNTTGTGLTQTWNTKSTTPAFPDGVYDVQVVATDKIGNASSSLVNVVVDNTNPSGSVSAPLAGSSLRNTVA